MCDVPSIAVFCSESIECFPGTASKFFLKLLVTIPVAPVITGTILLLLLEHKTTEEEMEGPISFRISKNRKHA